MMKIAESKAFVLALLTLVAAVAGYEGLDLPVTTVMGLLTPLMVAIGAAGWSDAVQMKSKMALEHDVKMHALQHGNVTINGVMRDAEGRMPARSVQTGSVRLGVMALTVILIGSLLGTTMVTNEGCGASPPPIVTDVVDCVKAEAVVVTDGYSIVQVINAVYGAIASIATGGLPAVVTVLSGITAAWGPDLVACVIDDYPTTDGTGSAAPLASVKFGVTLDASTKAALLQRFAPNKKFNHGKTK